MAINLAFFVIFTIEKEGKSMKFILRNFPKLDLEKWILTFQCRRCHQINRVPMGNNQVNFQMIMDLCQVNLFKDICRQIPCRQEHYFDIRMPEFPMFAMTRKDQNSEQYMKEHPLEHLKNSVETYTRIESLREELEWDKEDFVAFIQDLYPKEFKENAEESYKEDWMQEGASRVNVSDFEPERDESRD